MTRKHEPEEGIDFEVSNTPITKYKTRRKLMTEQKLLTASQTNQDGEPEARSSFSGVRQSLTASFNKLKGQNESQKYMVNEAATDAEGEEGAGWINEIGFTKQEKQHLENEENIIYRGFQKKMRRWGYFALTVALVLPLLLGPGIVGIVQVRRDIHLEILKYCFLSFL